MANTTGMAEDAIWPTPKFNFEVDFGTTLKGISFQEVSGMNQDAQYIEYRNSNSPLYKAMKMPGHAKHGNVTMKRGVFAADMSFWNWTNQIQMNTAPRITVLIKLLDQTGAVQMQWQLLNAWPTKISAPDLKSDGNEVAIDTLEIAYETLVVTNV